VEALRKFREKDPRTEPLLRAEKKYKAENRKAFQNQLIGVMFGLILAFFLIGSRDCSASSYDSPRRSYRH
jgi:hypothetical protein